MNKMVITMVLCVASYASYGLAAEVKVTPLSTEQEVVYQGLVNKYHDKKLTQADQTRENIGVLKHQKAFLSAQINKKQSLLRYLIPATVSPLIELSGYIGYHLKDKIDMLQSYSIRSIQMLMGRLLSVPYQLVGDINEAMGLPAGTIRAALAVAPMVAFYGLYKKYSALKNQSQELEVINQILAILT